MNLSVKESIAQDEDGWFWIAEMTFKEHEGGDTIGFRSNQYFKSEHDAIDDLESARPNLYRMINSSLQEIGLYLEKAKPKVRTMH